MQDLTIAELLDVILEQKRIMATAIEDLETAAEELRRRETFGNSEG